MKRMGVTAVVFLAGALSGCAGMSDYAECFGEAMEDAGTALMPVMGDVVDVVATDVIVSCVLLGAC